MMPGNFLLIIFFAILLFFIPITMGFSGRNKMG